MNIQAPRPQSQATPSRKQAQKKFEEARQTHQEARDAYWDSYQSSRNRLERNVLIGGGIGLVANIAAVTYFQVPIDHWAALALGPIVGGGIGAAIEHFSSNRSTVKELEKEMQESYPPLADSRDVYTEELLKEVNDDGVQKSWEHLTQSYPYKTNDVLDDFTALADARHQQGWRGDLARKQDDIAKFADQTDFINSNPEIQELLEA